MINLSVYKSKTFPALCAEPHPNWMRVVRTQLGSAALLFAFGAAMAASSGPKEPLDYSVLSAVAAALDLAQVAARRAHGDAGTAFALSGLQEVDSLTEKRTAAYP